MFPLRKNKKRVVRSHDKLTLISLAANKQICHNKVHTSSRVSSGNSGARKVIGASMLDGWLESWNKPRKLPASATSTIKMVIFILYGC